MGSMKDLLGDQPAPFVYPSGPGHRGVSTSVRAAASVAPHVSASQQKILDFLAARKSAGGTFEEIMAGAKMSSGSVCGRMVELSNAKLVRHIGERPTSSGRAARVYIHHEFCPPAVP